MQIFSKLLFFSFNYPKTNIALFLICAFLSIFLSMNNIKIVTSTDELISKDLEFRKKQMELKDKFPNLSNNNVISIKVDNRKELKRLTKEVLSDFSKKKDIFNFYYSPQIDESFRKNLLKIADNSAREEIIFQLYKFQPLFSVLNNNPKLKGLNDIFELSMNNDGIKENSSQYRTILEGFIDSIKFNRNLDWSELFFNGNENLIIFSLKNEYLENNDFSNFYSLLLNIKERNVDKGKINFTGGQILDYEELLSVSQGAIKASILSMIFISLVLAISFRNIKIILSLLFSIFIGLIITLGITSVTVGKLNIISIAFAVLFIGISVDFGIQISMKLLQSQTINLSEKLRNFSFSIFIVGISSIIGFLSFIPTKYIGLSELGIISSIGVIVGVLTNLLFLSSLLKIANIEKISYKNDYINIFFSKTVLSISKKPKTSILFFIILFFSASVNLEKIKFDSDPLKLKDQNSSSVKLAYDLMRKDPSSDYKISVVDKDFDNELLSELEKNDFIDSIFRLKNRLNSDNISSDLEYLDFLFSLPENNVSSKSIELNRFKDNLEEIQKLKIPDVSNSAKKLLTMLDSKNNQERDITYFENLFFDDFAKFKFFLKDIVNVDNSNYSELPLFYRDKYFSEDDFERIEIYPKKKVIDENKTETFVNIVKKIFPQATGMPVVQNAAKSIVIESFIFAFILSFICLVVFSFIIFRNILYVMLCFIPLFSSFLCTVFIMQALKINLNFANMISLPLLFSLGISYSIFILRGFQESKSFTTLMKSSIMPGVLFSALTTISSFSTFAISNHYGTSSMGVMLFICLTTVMINSLILLPLLIHKLKSRLL